MHILYGQFVRGDPDAKVIQDVQTWIDLMATCMPYQPTHVLLEEAGSVLSESRDRSHLLLLIHAMRNSLGMEAVNSEELEYLYHTTGKTEKRVNYSTMEGGISLADSFRKFQNTGINIQELSDNFVKYVGDGPIPPYSVVCLLADQDVPPFVIKERALPASYPARKLVPKEPTQKKQFAYRLRPDQKPRRSRLVSLSSRMRPK